jgi:vancomycin permeability regulator SanA
VQALHDLDDQMAVAEGRAPMRRRPRRRGRWLARVVLAVVGLGVLYVGVTFVQVWMASNEQDDGPADAIIVLGAAQYDGQPSPVLQARLDQALALYDAGAAGAVIVTGGKQEGDRFTEAFSSYDELRSNGVPEEDIYLEVDGTNTYEQLSAAHVIMGDAGFESALLVSDPYHSKRLVEIADEVGIEDAEVAPTDAGSTLTSLARETAAVSLGRIVGFRRMDNWF